MDFWRELLDVAARPDDTPDAPPPSPEGQIRVHLFCGTFDTEEDLLGYCFDPVRADGPEPFNLDLQGAYVDTAYVATGYGPAIPEALADFFDPANAQDILPGLKGDNALVIVSEYAFGGFPYSLTDTPRLRYLGNWLVDLP